jgi:hypothetical protein
LLSSYKAIAASLDDVDRGTFVVGLLGTYFANKAGMVARYLHMI